MCKFEPSQRVTVIEALEHPHLEEWHDPDDEPVCERGEFTYTFDEADAENALLRQFAHFHPEVGEHIKALQTPDDPAAASSKQVQAGSEVQVPQQQEAQAEAPGQGQAQAEVQEGQEKCKAEVHEFDPRRYRSPTEYLCMAEDDMDMNKFAALAREAIKGQFQFHYTPATDKTA